MMNLATTIDIYCGGPGSGCHGENCGRHVLVKKGTDDERTPPRDWYHINTSEGKRIGTAEVHMEGDTLVVDWIAGVLKTAADWSFPKDVNVRDLLRQLKSIYPNATKVAGKRVTGTRRDEPKGKWTTVPIHAMELVWSN